MAILNFFIIMMLERRTVVIFNYVKKHNSVTFSTLYVNVETGKPLPTTFFFII